MNGSQRDDTHPFPLRCTGMVPVDALGDIAEFCSAETLQALHCTSSAVAFITTGKATMTSQQLYHFKFGQRIHNLQLEMHRLASEFFDKKCVGGRARSGADRQVYNKCIDVGAALDTLRCYMENIHPGPYWGDPGSFMYYGRGDAMFDPPRLSDAETLTSGDLDVISSYINRLHSCAVDALGEVRAHLHDPFGIRMVERVVNTIGRRIHWMQQRRG